MKKKNSMQDDACLHGSDADGKSSFCPEIQGGKGGENPVF